MSKPYNKNLANSIKVVLAEIGENSGREGLLKTPERVAKSMEFLTNGYEKNPSEILKSAMFAEDYSQMVLVKDIELYSLCEHHILPFFGKDQANYMNSVIINFTYMALVLPSLFFAKNPIISRYWFFSLIIIYLFIYLILYRLTKN